MYVKVCGITHIDDALAAVAAGVDVLGFNRIPSSKRFLDDTGIVTIVRELRRRGPAPAPGSEIVGDGNRESGIGKDSRWGLGGI